MFDDNNKKEDNPPAGKVDNYSNMPKAAGEVEKNSNSGKIQSKPDGSNLSNNLESNREERPKAPEQTEKDKNNPAQIEDILAETDTPEEKAEKPAAFQPKQPGSEDQALEEKGAAADESDQKFKKIFTLLIIIGVLILFGVLAFWGYNRFVSNDESAVNKEINTQQPENTNTQTPPPENTPSVKKPDNPVVKKPAEKSAIDTDKDGLSDEEEVSLGTDPNKVDSDGDGLFDLEEVKVYKTDPMNPDTDGDGFLDGAEVKDGYNPNGAGKLYEIKR